MNRSFILAVSLLAGTIIGAGIFSLPYVFQKLGFAASGLYLVFFAIVYFFIHFMYAELVEKNRGTHEFFYLAHQYLPKSFAGIASFLMILELVLVLVVYLALAPSFLSFLFQSNSVKLAFGFWLFSSIFIFVPVKWLSRVELLGIFGILVIIFLIFAAGSWSFQNLKMAPQTLSWPLLVLPFGPLLFAFSGRPAISRVIDICRETKKHPSMQLGASKKIFSLKKAIFWGTFLPALVYLFFVVSVLRLTPAPVPDVVSGLGFLPQETLVILGILGFVTLWTSYFMIGINIREIVREDIGWSRVAATFLAVFVPILFYLFGADNFLRVMAFTGGVLLGLEAVLVITMWRKAFRYHSWRWASALLYPVFLVAIGYEIWNFFR